MLDQLAYHNIYHVHATNKKTLKNHPILWREVGEKQNHYFYNLRPPSHKLVKTKKYNHYSYI